MSLGQSVKRVDAYDKVTGTAKYTADICPPNALYTKIVRSTIANGLVISVDITDASIIPGVVKILTCFDAPEITFPTAGHPWSTDPSHQDVADRHVLEKRVRFYGDDVAAVLAETELAAAQAASLVKVQYEEYPFVIDQLEAMQEGAPLLHDNYPNNILAHSVGEKGDWDATISEPDLLCLDKWYDTPTVQHCHIENHNCYAYYESGKVVVVSSTQIPHIVRRCTAQALGLPWGKVRIIKPYIGGGFGNKQDALYEPLCAWLTTQVGGRPVRIDVSREETFYCNRVRHAIRFRLVTYFRKDGSFVARKMEAYSKQGAYASHGHSIAAKGAGAFAQIYKCDASRFDAYTIFTNTPVSGAMRGYGMPQATFAMESHVDDIAHILGMNPIEIRRKNLMEVGFEDNFFKTVNWTDSHEQCIKRAIKLIGWDEKYNNYVNQNDSIRRGIGMSIFWYNTGVWPISLETSACRMVLNQDGSIQIMTGETEIGQGCDTVFAQMAADTVGIPVSDVHVISTQDTDVHPFGTGAYASRQTYVGGMAIHKTGLLLREKILNHAKNYVNQPVESLNISGGFIVDRESGDRLMSLCELSTEVLYSMDCSEHIAAESTHHCKSNAYSFGCCFAEVEVDVPMCKAKLVNIVNVHDCGSLINPQLAEAQVHGGMSMAIGYGMGEQLLIDNKNGKPLNANLLDYKLSTSLDHPDLIVDFVQNAEPTSPYGTKSLGEPPAVPGASAIRNAILNATGVTIDTAPVTPHNMFQRFKEEGLL